jgi:hypothetical protein
MNNKTIEKMQCAQVNISKNTHVTIMEDEKDFELLR